jgi:pimeloyl-ACP methyl ester carboxylesterase
VDWSNSLANVADVPVDLSTRAQPFYFISNGQPLLAWLHTPANEIVFDHAVILCTSLGYEHVHAYRGLRHLASALAGRGIPVLRFDWFGTGDSAGDDQSHDLVANWKANIRDAVALLKNEYGFAQVSVIGFRLGALLAVEGLAENDSRGQETQSFAIENFVLWAPVASGRAYTRELRLLHSTALGTRQSESGTKEDLALESGGFSFSAQTAADLADLNLTQHLAPFNQALVVQRDDMASDRKVLNWLAAQDVTAEVRTLPGVKDLLVEPHYTQVPDQAIAAISTWLVERLNASSGMRVFDTREVCESNASGALVSHQEAGDVSVDFREFVWQSKRPDLMGVVTEPLQIDSSLPLVVFLNSGAAYRIGVNRLYVLMARQLARRGFRSLRFDFRGLGDSPAEHAECENDTYPSTGFEDMAAALDAAGCEFGHDCWILAGLCSGAYFAFQAAAQFRDPGLVECILINPLTYFWREGMTIDDPELRDARESSWRFTRKLDGSRLWKFLTGRSQIGYFGAAREVVARLVRPLAIHFTHSTPMADTRHLTDEPRRYGHPLEKDLPRDLLKVARAERKLTLFLADTDPGLAILNAQAPRQVRQLMTQGILGITKIANADHTFSQSMPRGLLIDQIASHLSRRYL